jgi:hypothetical protein
MYVANLHPGLNVQALHLALIVTGSKVEWSPKALLVGGGFTNSSLQSKKQNTRDRSKIMIYSASAAIRRSDSLMISSVNTFFSIYLTLNSERKCQVHALQMVYLCITDLVNKYSEKAVEMQSIKILKMDDKAKESFNKSHMKTQLKWFITPCLNLCCCHTTQTINFAYYDANINCTMILSQ